MCGVVRAAGSGHVCGVCGKVVSELHFYQQNKPGHEDVETWCAWHGTPSFLIGLFENSFWQAIIR